MRARVISVVAVAWLAACIDSPLVPCGDQYCPPGNVCTAGGCATPADVDACLGHVDGDGCRAANGGAGTCQGGACRTGLCGNGTTDVGEACDDGNQVSGDGCRADCGKKEICGDGMLDTGEVCDDGNHNPADGCDECVQTVWNVSTVVGSAVSATSTALANPGGVAIDEHGRIYIADTDNHRIRRVETDGSITTIAGTGTPGFSGDGGAATSAQLRQPGGVAVDGIGRVFVADTVNHRIRRIEIDGTISTIAGTGFSGGNGDGGPAILAELASPHAVAVDGLGRVVIADTDNNKIRQVETDGTISTIAGTGNPTFGGEGGPATDADLQGPYGVAVDDQGRVLVADTQNQRIRRIEANGTLATIAGTGSIGYTGDTMAATSATLAFPVQVSVDAAGRIAIADTLNHAIRRIAANGTIDTVTGTGSPGFGGDGGAASGGMLSLPFGVAVDGPGKIAIADTANQRIRVIDLADKITTLAGSGIFGFGGDGREATSAQLANQYTMAVDAMGRIYIADTFNHRIRRVELDGTITTVAGTGIAGFSGDGGPATSAQVQSPGGILVDALGQVYIADTRNHRVRRIDTTGMITTIAGDGTPAFGGDTGQATSAQLQNPNSIALDSLGRIYIADTYNNRIRRIALDGKISTVAGNGSPTYGGDTGPATSASISFPYAITVDGTDRLVISDTGNHRIRRVTGTTIDTIAGDGTQSYGGDGFPAVTAQLNSPYGVVIDGQGRVVFADTYNQRIRRIELDATITTVIGDGTAGNSGDAGPPLSAELGYPLGVTIDGQGNLIISDTNNNRIRKLSGGTLSTVAGKVDPENIGPVTDARLEDPQAIVVGSTLTLVAAGTSGTLEAIRGGHVEAIAGRFPETLATAALARFRTDSFGTVGGTALDPGTGKIYLTETSANRLHVITQVNPADPRTWTIATLANTLGTAGFADGAAATARFRNPTGLYLDVAAQTLYIADSGNHAIRALALGSNTVSTVINTSHSLGFAGDDGPATAALLHRPTALARCANGDLFIADTDNNRVRRVVASTGIITTVLGDGVPASSGEGEPARTFPVDAPRGLGCDELGNLFVTSSTTVRLVTANPAGIVDGTGRVQTIYGAPPRATFPSSVTSCLTGLAVTSATTVQFADACTGLLVQLERTAAP